MHTNHTTNYELSQFIGTDKPTFLGDYNGDMLKIDTAIAGVGATATGADAKADAAVTAAETASDTASDAATLANTANTNANSALATAGNAATAASAAQTAAATAQTTAATAQTTAESAGTAASAADSKATAANTAIGDLTQLTTSDKTDLVNAINEVNAKPSGGGTAADISYDNTDSGLTATDVQAAIDEIVASYASPVIEYDSITFNQNSVFTFTGKSEMRFDSATVNNTTYAIRLNDRTAAQQIQLFTTNMGVSSYALDPTHTYAIEPNADPSLVNASVTFTNLIII